MTAILEAPQRLQQADVERTDSEYDICMALAEQREQERTLKLEPAPITFKQARALQAINKRMHELPPEYRSTVQLSPYMQVVLGIPPQ